MCKLDPYLRLNANGNGETKCIIFVDDCKTARKQLKNFLAVIVASYPFINGFGALVSVHKLEDLASLSCVKAISSHTTVTACMEKTAAELNLNLLYNNGLYGKGITVAVIDTGLRPHIDLFMPQKRAMFVDFIEGREVPYDDNGHGTAVSSIISGSGLISNGKYSGVAPKSNMISLKAIASNGEGGAFAILEAMQWIYTNRNKYNIKVVCMSFGSDPVAEGIDPLSYGAQTLWKSGIVVVTSAGNDGPNSKTIKSPGCNEHVITVGGAEINGENITIPDFSSRGPVGFLTKPDIVAPSINITCCGIKKQYDVFSGTSMAAPIVAGIAALILEKNPELTPNRIKELIIENAVKLDYDANTAGAGLLSLDFINELI